MFICLRKPVNPLLVMHVCILTVLFMCYLTGNIFATASTYPNVS